MHISISAEPIFYLWNFPVTNTLLISTAIVLSLIIFSFFLNKRLKTIPSGIQNIIEYILESLLNLVDSVTGSREQSKKFFPLVASIFIFVILSNWVEILPGLGTIGIKEINNGKEVIKPFIRSSSSDLNVTLSIALISVFSVQILGITAMGIKKYSKRFFVNPFKKPYVVGTFVGILEIISELAKIISFSFRLFGNIFAGEVVLIISLFLLPYFFNILPLPFLFLELFVGFIQALIFSMLTLIFLKVGCTEIEE